MIHLFYSCSYLIITYLNCLWPVCKYCIYQYVNLVPHIPYWFDWIKGLKRNEFKELNQGCVEENPYSTECQKRPLPQHKQSTCIYSLVDVLINPNLLNMYVVFFYNIYWILDMIINNFARDRKNNTNKENLQCSQTNGSGGERILYRGNTRRRTTIRIWCGYFRWQQRTACQIARQRKVLSSPVYKCNESVCEYFLHLYYLHLW